MTAAWPQASQTLAFAFFSHATEPQQKDERRKMGRQTGREKSVSQRICRVEFATCQFKAYNR
eukprot:2113211-Prorocentrum_lima.AAC.1